MSTKTTADDGDLRHDGADGTPLIAREIVLELADRVGREMIHRTDRRIRKTHGVTLADLQMADDACWLLAEVRRHRSTGGAS